MVAGRYRLRESLGRGGMGIVWLASDEYLHRDVAIKEIQLRGREIRDSDPEVRRALREARAAAKLSGHDGIITVHDVVTDDRGLPWIVMELLHGRSLHTVLHEDGPLPVDKAARIGIQVLAALDYAHQAGVLHRDVKPGNVMLVRDNGSDKSGDKGEYKTVLTDFGIAVIDGASVLTATGQLPGAPEYVAPERILGEESQPAADLWSVGIMLYMMVVGRTPFHRADLQATLGAALAREPDPDPAVGRLAPVIAGLLRKKPGERWTAAQAIAKLSEIAAVPGRIPAGVRVRFEYPTTPDQAEGQVTVADATVPSTMLGVPAFSPAPQRPRVAPDSPTVPPNWSVPPPPRSPARRNVLVAAGVVLVVAAVVAGVLWTSGPDDDGGAGAAPPETTTTVPDVPLTQRTEDLGFVISVPDGWQRDASAGSDISDVAWQAAATDPKVGALEVRVRRDRTAGGATAEAYLTDVKESESAGQDRTGFDAELRPGDGSFADLEYTYRSGRSYYRAQTRAYASDSGVYTLRFLLWATDEETLRAEWRARTPLMDKISKSLQLT